MINKTCTNCFWFDDDQFSSTDNSGFCGYFHETSLPKWAEDGDFNSEPKYLKEEELSKDPEDPCLTWKDPSLRV